LAKWTSTIRETPKGFPWGGRKTQGGIELKQTFKSDPYFLAHVTIKINPNKEQGITDCYLVVDRSKSDWHLPSYTWSVTISRLIESPTEALEELKQERYITEGYSETF
jgi:hypothetical protein